MFEEFDNENVKDLIFIPLSYASIQFGLPRLCLIICPTHMSDSDLGYHFTYIHNLWRCKQIKLLDIGLLRDQEGTYLLYLEDKYANIDWSTTWLTLFIKLELDWHNSYISTWLTGGSDTPTM